ncbi:hypothetical protein [Bordetella petrii]|uniref:hypothetical protein n=1 Tax=Bordetella petrii TaxID=94624 RepID=UPI00047B0133|nr:hypothetical protein [Bordetella petrii]
MQKMLKYAAAALALIAIGYLSGVGLMSVVFTSTTGTFSPSNSGEAAAWIQAIGTIVAITASFFLGRQQAEAAHRSALDLDRQRQTRREIGAHHLQIQLLDACDAAISWMTQAADASQFTGLWNETYGPTLHSAMRVFDSIPLFDACAADRISHAFSIRQLADQIARQGDRARSPPPPAFDQIEFLSMKRRNAYFRERLKIEREILQHAAPTANEN